MIPETTESGVGSGNADSIFSALDEILASRPFRSSSQCSTLLRYVVEHTLAGEDNLLRERVIGVELFGRSADYQTSEDPVVRLRVSEVRKRLAQYYLSAENAHGLQIEIPSGAYKASFRSTVEAHPPAEKPSSPSEAEFVEVAVEEEAVASLVLPPSAADAETARDHEAEQVFPSSSIGVPRSPGQPFLRKPAALGTFVFLVLAAVMACVFLWTHSASHKTPFQAFWVPWLNSSQPVIISVGSNAVYRLSPNYLSKYSVEHALAGQGQEFYVPLEPNQQLRADEIYPAWNSYVALGDVSAVSDVVANLSDAHQRFQERFPNDVSFAELRNAPAILIGGFNNSMTLELGKHLRFVMIKGNEIDDTSRPNRKWVLNASPDSRETADYAIITRIVNRGDDAPIISVAGLGQYGTLAAAEAICSPIKIHLVTDHLPPNWTNHNFQAVVRINVNDFKATISEVVASTMW